MHSYYVCSNKRKAIVYYKEEIVFEEDIMAKKKINVTFSSTNEKSIEDVITNLIASHKGIPKTAIETENKKESKL